MVTEFTTCDLANFSERNASVITCDIGTVSDILNELQTAVKDAQKENDNGDGDAVEAVQILVED